MDLEETKTIHMTKSISRSSLQEKDQVAPLTEKGQERSGLVPQVEI